MARITEECVARIKDSADVVELIGRYIPLRRAGNAWKACCPFHNEKTPSFSVNPARQTFHCFGCGVGGDAVRFLMMFENLDYPTALRRLADINGIPVIEEEENPEVARLRRRRSRIIQVNELAADYFHRQLCRSREASHVREYLKQRGFNIEIARAWQLGWAPPSFAGLQRQASEAGMDQRLLTDAYLLGNGRSGLYPVFRDRLMFPIRNVRGEVVGFSGRIMEEGKDPRKYVNTAETPAFRKGELLFGLHRATGAMARAGMTAVICEGQLDVIACHEKAELRHAVAGLGTAFTDEHAHLLRKYARKAILCYDGDAAGIKASEKTYRKLAQAGLQVFLATLPPGEDPDSLIRHEGPEPLQEAIRQARPYLEARVSHELTTLQGDSNARAALIPRMADLASEITDANLRDVAVVDLATRLNTGLDNLRDTVAEMIRARAKSSSSTAVPVATIGAFSSSFPSGSFPAEADGDKGDEEAEELTPVVPLRLHPTIRGLLHMAAADAEAQALLAERIEELQEPIRSLSGGVILQKLMEKLPSPGNTEEWNAFLAALPPEQSAALRNMDTQPLQLDSPLRCVEQACARAARDSIKARLDQLRARIHGGQLPEEESLAIIRETARLQQLLNG